MPVMEIKTGENNFYDIRYSNDNNYNSSSIQVGDKGQIGNPLYNKTLKKGFVRFNLDALKNKIITRATMKLHVSYSGGRSFVQIGTVTSNVKIYDISSNNQPNVSDYDAFTVYEDDGGTYRNRTVTSLIRNMVEGKATTDIIALYGEDYNADMATVEFGGFSSSNPPILEVEYENPPHQKPTELSPDKTHIQREKNITVSWKFEPVDDNDVQTAFNLEYSEDGGKTYKSINENTSRTNYTFLETQLTTGNVKWRVRTRNKDLEWSPWAEASFTWSQIQPTRPQQLKPDGVQLETLPVATWVYTPYNTGDRQTAFELEYSNDGGVTYTNVLQNTSNMSYAFPSSLKGGLIKWRVRSKSSYFGVFSPWSEYALWTYAIPPAKPVITSGTTFATPVPTITWTSDEQISFELEVVKDDIVVLKTGERNTNHRNYKIETFLENHESYTIRLRVKNAVPLWSEWVEQEINIDFVQTDKPEIIVTEDTTKFGVKIKIINPVSGVTNEVWRRKAGESLWTRIAKNIPLNGVYADYMIRHDTFYDYRVRAVAAGSYSDSDTVTRKVQVRDSQLISLSNNDKYVNLVWNPKKNSKKRQEQKLVQYEGRKHPCTVWGSTEDYNININFTMEKELLDKLEELYNLQETLLFRDSRGRKEYVVIWGDLNVDDNTELGFLYDVSLVLQIVDYEEEV